MKRFTVCGVPVSEEMYADLVKRKIVTPKTSKGYRAAAKAKRARLQRRSMQRARRARGQDVRTGR